jgi:2,3-bisphosphoglycerate-independent phosphoglycerate mutase
MSKKKAFLFIADGLGGRPSDMNGKTCLEAADTPNLDELSSKGINGLLHPIGRGVRAGSDTSHLALFGYNPEKVYTGRGVFEASGIGMDVQEGDVCFRTNFATVDENLKVKDRRAGRIDEGQDRLEQALQDQLELNRYKDLEIKFRASTQHRGALILRGSKLSDNITDTDPHKTGTKIKECEPLDRSKDSKRTAKIINRITEKAHEILKDLELNEEREGSGKLPANGLLIRGASKPPDIQPFSEKYGLDGTAIAGGALYLGVAEQVGLQSKKPKGATGDTNSKIINKAKLAVKELEERDKDFVFIHVKGTDNAAHDHDPEAKKRFIEKIDGTVGYLIDNLDWENTHLTFTGDHTTPCEYGDHTAEPLPILFCGREVRIDSVEEFGERSCAEGDLGHMEGQEVLPLLFNYNNWLDKFGS